jgi:hypothetical protein
MRLADRRVATRFEIVGELWGSVQALEPVHVCNCSLGGALVESLAPLPVGSVQALRISQGTETAEVRAAVRHLSPIHLQDGSRRYRAGLEFVDLDERAAGWIDGFINEHRANEAAG